MTRELGDLAPVRDALAKLEQRRKAAESVKDDRVAAVLGEVEQAFLTAIDDAMRPPAGDGITPEEYARRNDLTRWAVYKQIQRGDVPARKVGGHWRIMAA